MRPRIPGPRLVDPDDRLTDLRMPERGTAGHLALLIATDLAGKGRMSRLALARLVTRLQREHAHHRSKVVAAESPAALAATAVQRLVALRLARVDCDDVGTRVTGLPAPQPGRWRPLRLARVDLFLYDAQEFHFHDGRLLIRGDNGSGRSKVLALTLPLLLDASLAPQRVEPDADPGKRMSWNLLQGGDYEERTGYSWIEFGRVDEQGEARFVTLGLEMKAVAGRDQLRHWWFTSSLRIGEGLHLGDRTRTVLTRDRLEAALGADGVVHETKEAYRRDVDGLLFALGEQRYGALVDLLVHLRQPQLSKRPDEKALAAALQEALPPLRQDVVDDVAQAFQTLEEDRRQLEDLRASAAAVRAFTTEYAGYARVAAARAADALRKVQSAVDRAQRTLRETTDAQATAASALGAAQQQSHEAQETVVRARARHGELRDLRSSDAFAQFERLGRELATAEREYAAAGSELDAAEAEVRRLRSDLERVRRAAEAAERSRAETARVASVAAEAAGVDVAAAVAGADTARITEEARRRCDQVGSLRVSLDRRSSAERAAAEANRRLDEAGALLQAAGELERVRVVEAAGAASTWIETTRAALMAAAELRSGDEETLGRIEAAGAWADEPDGPDPLTDWVADLQRRRSTALVEQRVAAETERAALRAAVGVLDAERAVLEARTAIEPATSQARTADRAGRPGEPFWRTVEFSDAVSETDRAGLEAALEGAGLLDAWVPEDAGRVELPGDVVLIAEPVTGRTLADVLVPASDGIDPGRVRELLGSVALGLDAPAVAAVAVDSAGRFRAGPARGAFVATEARYIGEAARERARIARLAAIADETVGLQERAATADVAARSAAERSRALAREVASLPSDAAVRTASARLVDAAAARGRTSEAVDGRSGKVDAAARALGRARDDAPGPRATCTCRPSPPPSTRSWRRSRTSPPPGRCSAIARVPRPPRPHGSTRPTIG